MVPRDEVEDNDGEDSLSEGTAPRANVWKNYEL